jgi:glycolate oxidase iron-sulfur subunit
LKKIMNLSLKGVYDEVSKCNRCGFCQAHCPIFELTGDERNVARGHNVHVRKLVEGSLRINPDFKDPLFECLLCKACVANCFPAVRTDKNVIAGRAEYLKRLGQPKLFRFLFHRLLPDPVRLATYVRLAAVGKNSGMTKLAGVMGVLKWFGKDLDKAEGIVEKLPQTFFRERAPHLPLGTSPAKKQLVYFVGCGFNFVLPRVSEATLQVLGRTGARIQIADNCCCGLPAYGYGDLEAARKMAARNIATLEALEGEAVITDCGSCSAFLKEYPELFEDDPGMKNRAERLAKRVKGFSEYLRDWIPAGNRTKSPYAKVTYHDPCHLSRYQGIVKEPRSLLKKIPGIDYVELPEADRCCGAAGSYNLLHYEQSMKVLDRKMENIRRTGADVVATECPGCMIQLGYGARRTRTAVRVIHLSELISDVFP